jgi:hypothetical protein
LEEAVNSHGSHLAIHLVFFVHLISFTRLDNALANVAFIFGVHEDCACGEYFKCSDLSALQVEPGVADVGQHHVDNQQLLTGRKPPVGDAVLDSQMGLRLALHQEPPACASDRGNGEQRLRYLEPVLSPLDPFMVPGRHRAAAGTHDDGSYSFVLPIGLLFFSTHGDYFFSASAFLAFLPFLDFLDFFVPSSFFPVASGALSSGKRFSTAY